MRARLMSEERDFEKLGLKKGEVEVWEDGRRTDFEAGVFEWWYFDAILDDGSKVAACYCTKVQPFTFMPGLHPSLSVDVTTPDGEKHSQKFTKFDKDQVKIAKGGCDVEMGPHRIAGDLTDYRVKAEPVDGLGFDLELHKTCSSWRGDTGYLGFGDEDQKYFTWLCAVPRGTVHGTVTVDGVTHEVAGAGYHDHQWGNTIHFDFLNNWLWSRQSLPGHTVVLFDFIMNEKYDNARVPLFFVQDAQGEVVFESTDNVECRVVEELHQTASDTDFPKITEYVFKDGGKTCTYTLSVVQELDARDIYHSVPAPLRLMFKGTKPKYGRYLAEGDLKIEGEGVDVHERGQLIYEFSYVGPSYKGLMDTRG